MNAVVETVYYWTKKKLFYGDENLKKNQTLQWPNRIDRYSDLPSRMFTSEYSEKLYRVTQSENFFRTAR